VKTALFGRLAMLALVCASAADAQTVVHVRVDNDAFNFWQQPWDRPDEEYSSGVRLSADFRGLPFWAFWMKRGPMMSAPCARPRERCADQSWTLGQDIYTAPRKTGDQTPLPGSRPDAGLFWLQSMLRIARAERLDELGLTIGVTGEPALASTFQRIAHSIASGWTQPVDWTSQLPFEPVFGVAYDSYRLARVGVLELQPHAGASLGNLLTEARVGLGARVGWNMLPPFLSAATEADYGVTVAADATARGVVWNETLSGTLFRASQHVTLRPLVAEWQIGVSARLKQLTLSYVVHQTGAEYTAMTAPHQWSSLQAAWEFGK
jgi:lipid A 3-O-deacylase